MKTYSIVPPGSIVNGRVIHDHVRDGRYHKYYWSCIIHKVVADNPMRIKDMRNRKGPACCYDRSGKMSPTWAGYEDIPMTYINQVKNGAVLRGHEHTIEPIHMWQQWLEQFGKCAYSGRDIVLGVDASLDRIDSAVGYVPGNIQWLHKDVNLAKQQLSDSEFIDMCKEIVEHVKLVRGI